jgi:nickel transport protein
MKNSFYGGFNMKSVMHLRNKMGLLITLFATAFTISALFVGSASAHKFVVTAWVEGDMVYVESGFSDGSPAKNAETVVFDDQGNSLIEGQTNEYGEYSFKVPKKTAMRVVVKAGMGHQGESEISLEDLAEVSLEKDEEASTAMTTAPAVDRSEVQGNVVVTGGLTAADIQSAMEKALDKKLRPIVKNLSKAKAGGPAVSDIFGGIGYILGLVGIGAYFNFRKKAA